MDVRVHRNDELGGRDRPQAQVHSIGGANHPAGVEDEAFASASGPRVADQMPKASTAGLATKRIGKAGQGFPEIPIARSMKRSEGMAERFMLA